MAFYGDLTDGTSLARVLCLVIQCILGDFVIVSALLLSTLAHLLNPAKIWRLYVVYGKRFWVVVPLLLLVISYTGRVSNLGFRVLTHLTYLTGF